MNIQKKKMAIVCSTDYESYPMGGMMSFILDSLPFLDKYFDITLWGVLVGEKSKTHIVINGKTYPFKSFSKVKVGKKIIPNLLRVSFSIWKKQNELLADNYDVLYIHGIPLSFPFFKQNNVAVVNHIHGMTNPFSMTANRAARNNLSIYLYERYRDWVVKKSDMIFLASDKQGHKQFSQRYPAEENKIEYIPNFADQEIFKNISRDVARKELGINEHETIFVNTGRVSLQKDPILLVKSFIYYIKHLKGLGKLVIIGDGELREHIEELAKDNDIEDKLIITGKIDRSRINLWLNAADLYVYTSHANGFPISLAEAATCGLPIVTTDVTGVHDLVVEEKTGYLIQQRNEKLIANAMQKALVNKEKFSQNIYEISKAFTPEIVLEKMNKKFLSLN